MHSSVIDGDTINETELIVKDVVSRLQGIFDDYQVEDLPLGLVGILDVALTGAESYIENSL